MKSTSDLRQILERMQKELEERPSAGKGSVAAPGPPGVREPAGAPAESHPPAVAPGRGEVRTDPPSGARPVPSEKSPPRKESSQSRPHDRSAILEDRTGEAGVSYGWLRWVGLWSCVAVVLTGILLQSYWIVSLGFLGLLVLHQTLLRSTESRLEEMEELSKRVAILERRGPSFNREAGGGDVPPELAEQIEELRTMVRSLFKALQEAHDEGSGTEHGKGG